MLKLKKAKKLPSSIETIVKIAKKEVACFENYAEGSWKKLNEKEKYQKATKSRFNNLFNHYITCLLKKKINKEDHFLSASDILKKDVKQLKNPEGTIYTTKRVISRILKEWYEKELPFRKKEIEIGIVSAGTNCKYRFFLKLKGQDSLDLLLENPSVLKIFLSENKNPSEIDANYKLLVPAEQYLKSLPSCSNTIEGKWMYPNDQIIEDLIVQTRKNQLYFIKGSRGSGKTVVARRILLLWNRTHQAMILDLKLKERIFNYAQFVNEVNEFCKNSTSSLIIIDDVEAKIKEINLFINEIRDNNTPINVIFILKDCYKEALFDGSYLTTTDHFRDNFQELSGRVLKASDLAEQIVYHYYYINEWEIDPESIQKTLSLTNGNLYHLSYFLSCLEYGTKFSEKNLISTIGKELDHLGKIDAINPYLLIGLSILSRFNEYTDANWLCDRFSSLGNKICILNSLQSMYQNGYIDRPIIPSYNAGQLKYGLHSSSIANLYFEYSRKGVWKDSELFGNEYEYIRSYILSNITSNSSRISLFRKLKINSAKKEETGYPTWNNIEPSDYHLPVFLRSERIFKSNFHASVKHKIHLNLAIFGKELINTVSFEKIVELVYFLCTDENPVALVLWYNLIVHDSTFLQKILNLKNDSLELFLIKSIYERYGFQLIKIQEIILYDNFIEKIYLKTSKSTYEKSHLGDSLKPFTYEMKHKLISILMEHFSDRIVEFTPQLFEITLRTMGLSEDEIKQLKRKA